MFPGLWHLAVGDIFPAKIRNQASRPPFQQRVDSPVAEGEHKAIQAFLVSELNSV